MIDRKQLSKNRESNVWKGLVAGLLGGLVASWAMNEFQTLVSKSSEGDEKSPSRRSANEKNQKVQQAGKQSEEKEEEAGDNATIKAASAIAEGVFDHKLTRSEKKIAGPAVHYTLGTMSGAFYGVAAEFAPVISAGAGLPFGAAFWLVGDEAALFALGLAKSPTEYPLSTHAYALASHFVYGLTTDVVRRAVRHAL